MEKNEVKTCSKCGGSLVYDGFGLEVDCDSCGYSVWFSDFESDNLDEGVLPFVGDLDDFIKEIYGVILDEE
ncbi:MAG: hypothetical protein LBT30_07510 [Clostridiales bacterium]|nr:hypothetical protein [Clostridiales bacterium]